MALRGAALLSLAVLLPGCGHKPAAEEPPSAEAKAYVSNLKLSEVAMKATENYAGGVVTEIEGKITNAGNKTVDYAAVACIFHDSLNQMVLRERVAIVKTPLKPGETRGFRLPFDNIPESWN